MHPFSIILQLWLGNGVSQLAMDITMTVPETTSICVILKSSSTSIIILESIGQTNFFIENYFQDNPAFPPTFPKRSKAGKQQLAEIVLHSGAL
jgi:hypothetical protein